MHKVLTASSLTSRPISRWSQGRHSILQHTPPELQLLYTSLEVEFNPLQLCRKVSPVLDGLVEDETLSQYVESTREVLLVRLIKEVSCPNSTSFFDCFSSASLTFLSLPPCTSFSSLSLSQVSQVYETVKLDWLANLVPFTTSTHLETVVIETAHSNGIQVAYSTPTVYVCVFFKCESNL